MKTKTCKEKNTEEYISRFRNMLSHKMILANILKECTDEFSAFDADFIFRNCIEGSAEIAEICSEEEAQSNDLYQKPFYDIRFYASVPETGEYIKFIIKIDLSGKRRTHEYRVRKGMFYAACMIAAQNDSESGGILFDDSIKAYTIWICPDQTGKINDSAVCYGSSERVISGKRPASADGSLMKVVTVYLDETSAPSLGTASVTDLLKLVMTEDPGEEEKNALSEIYGVII